MTLADMLRPFRLLEIQQRLINQQQDLIANQQRLLDDQQHQHRRVHLDYLREMRGLVAGWLLHLEQPELDLRHDLAELDQVLGHKVAELEEHVL